MSWNRIDLKLGAIIIALFFIILLILGFVINQLNFVRFGYAVIPLDLAGHLAHNLFHVFTEGKAIWFNTANLFGNQLTGELGLASVGTVQLMQYFVVLLGLVGSSYTVYRIGDKAAWKKLLPYYVFMVMLAVINIYLFSMPMNHRV